MGAKTSEQMKAAQVLIRNGWSVYAAAKSAGVKPPSIYQSTFWKERKSQKWWAKHPSNKGNTK